MMWTERHTALVQANDIAGIAYFDSDGDLNIVSIITTPSVQLNRAEWVIDQQGNKLTQGQEAVRLNAFEICSSVLVPIRDGLANILGLKWDIALILDLQNCTLWPGTDLDTAFPDNGVLWMVVFPCAFPFDYGSRFLEVSLDNLFPALASTTPATSIAYRIPPAGVCIALSALAKNNFKSFLDQTTQIGMKVVKFTTKFLEDYDTSICDTMCVTEKEMPSRLHQ